MRKKNSTKSHILQFSYSLVLVHKSHKKNEMKEILVKFTIPHFSKAQHDDTFVKCGII